MVGKPRKGYLTPMTTITELAKEMQKLLTTTADELGRKTGFVKRERKVSGGSFAQAMVFGFMSNAKSTREELRQAAASSGLQISTQGLDQRFTKKAANFLERLLAEAVETVIYGVPQTQSILSRFNGVYVGDSTVVGLPPELRAVFRGTNCDAAAKVAVQWELETGQLGLWLSDGSVHDQRTDLMSRALPAGAVRLNDLGFFNLKAFAQDEAQGVFYFSRYKVGTLVYSREGQPLDLSQWLHRHSQACELDICLGAMQLPCRLIALPVAAQQLAKRRQRLRETARRKQQPLSSRSLELASWTLYVTNIPASHLAPDESAVLGCTRWQIECLFDLWKNEGQLDETRSHDPLRVLCEFYAKLLTLLVQHWGMIVGCWQQLNRSLHRAAQLLRKRAFLLLENFFDLQRFIASLHRTAQLLAQTCGLSKRRAQPLTFQRWLLLSIP